MRHFVTIASATIASASAALALFATPLIAEEGQNEGLTEGEEKLAKMLEGREAGKPVSCIRTFPNARLTVIDGTALVYRQGSTLYVNVPSDPESLDDRDTLVTRTSSSQLCRTDIVTTVDLPSGIYTGNIFLGDFVPYRKVEKADS